MDVRLSMCRIRRLLNTKKASNANYFLIPLPILTFWFFRFCKGRFECQFRRFPLEDAMKKDTLEKATEPNLNLKLYLQDAYVHQVFKGTTQFERPTAIDEEENNPLVATRRSLIHRGSKQGSSDDNMEITKDIWFISGLGSDNDAGQAAIWHIFVHET
ncbi:hypothetical protein Tco_1415203 [Tanacetum coccineum]